MGSMTFFTGEGVSRYSSEVTTQMVCNFIRGGAGINALARPANTGVIVADMGVAGDLSRAAGMERVLSKRIAAGTQNMARGPALTRAQAVRSIEAGIEIAAELAGRTDVFGTGDMGIGNTTPSTAIACVLTGRPVAEMTGDTLGATNELVEAVVPLAICAWGAHP